MSNRSGFELRTDLLHMAYTVLNDNRAQVQNSFYARSEKEREGMELPIVDITSEQVIKEAKKLYSFVNEKA